MSTTIAPPQQQNYPTEIEVQLKLKISVEDADEREYYYLPDNSLNPGFLADLFDILDNASLISINDKTQLMLRKQLQDDLNI